MSIATACSGCAVLDTVWTPFLNSLLINTIFKKIFIVSEYISLKRESLDIKICEA